MGGLVVAPATLPGRAPGAATLPGRGRLTHGAGRARPGAGGKTLPPEAAASALAKYQILAPLAK
jgi:hypothetical protein